MTTFATVLSWFPKGMDPLQSHKTRVRMFLNNMTNNGFSIVSDEQLERITLQAFENGRHTGRLEERKTMAESKQAQKESSAPDQETVSDPSPESMTRREYAQFLYEEGRFKELIKYKRQSKVGWHILGITEDQAKHLTAVSAATPETESSLPANTKG